MERYAVSIDHLIRMAMTNPIQRRIAELDAFITANRIIIKKMEANPLNLLIINFASDR